VEALRRRPAQRLIAFSGLDYSIRHFGDGPKNQISDVQLHIGESLDSGFIAARCPGMTASKHAATAIRQHQAGEYFMKSIGPDSADPIPLRSAPAGMGMLVMRFVALLTVTVVVLALLWSR
jgi:hypothetical protein